MTSVSGGRSLTLPTLHGGSAVLCPPLHGCCPLIVAHCRFSHVLRPMWWQPWTSVCFTPGCLLPDTQSDQPSSCHVKGNGSLACVWCWYHVWFDTESDLSLVPFLPYSTLQGVSIVSVKHQPEWPHHSYSIAAFTEVLDCHYRGCFFVRFYTSTIPSTSAIFRLGSPSVCVKSIVSRPTASPCRPLASCSCYWASSGVSTAPNSRRWINFALSLHGSIAPFGANSALGVIVNS